MAAGNESRLTFTVEETAQLLGLSRGLAYEAVRNGEIPSIRIGRRILIPRVALERILNATTALTEIQPDPGCTLKIGNEAEEQRSRASVEKRNNEQYILAQLPRARDLRTQLE